MSKKQLASFFSTTFRWDLWCVEILTVPEREVALSARDQGDFLLFSFTAILPEGDIFWRNTLIKANRIAVSTNTLTLQKICTAAAHFLIYNEGLQSWGKNLILECESWSTANVCTSLCQKPITRNKIYVLQNYNSTIKASLAPISSTYNKISNKIAAS